MNQLDALRQWTTVVADTGAFQEIGEFKPRDATTNPSLILKAVSKPEYSRLLEAAKRDSTGRQLDEVVDQMLVWFGCETLSIIPGRVSTEVDARLSFDTAATVARAQRLIALYRAQGIDTEQRVLIKIAATWEGIEAARQLERQGVHCNLTLLFSMPQAIACGAAKVRLISPFVGRVLDWHKKQVGAAWDEKANAGASDPGVQLVRSIFETYKRNGIETQVMGASFRNIGEIAALAGCDLLTISPELLRELSNREEPLTRVLDAQEFQKDGAGQAQMISEPEFRFALNEDAMASEKLAEGIRVFASDAVRLDRLLGAANG